MTEDRDQLKDRWLQHSQNNIGNLLEQKGDRRDLRMVQTEALIGKLELPLQQALMQALVDEAQVPQAVGRCAGC